MTREQKSLLKQHAEHFQAMANAVVVSGNEELLSLEDACCAASSSNCGWDVYQAASFLLPEIRSEILRRELRNKSVK